MIHNYGEAIDFQEEVNFDNIEVVSSDYDKRLNSTRNFSIINNILFAFKAAFRWYILFREEKWALKDAIRVFKFNIRNWD